MKILMVITGMKHGGAERVMATLCNELSKHHDVRLAIIKSDERDYKLSEAVEVVSGSIKNQSLYNAVEFVASQFKEYQADVVLSFMTKTNLVTLLAKKISKSKKPIVIAERANPAQSKPIFKFLRKVLIPSAQGAIFQTELAREYYRNNRLLRCEGVVLRNPLSPDFRVVPYAGKRTKRIVSVGRLSKEKNHKLLIAAFADLADEFQDYIVEIYGDGPLRDELCQYIKELHLENRVILMGRKDNIQEQINDAEVFVLPSDSEGMPNALIEAMALGLACIATDCPIGGSAVIIDNNYNGILIPVENKTALSNAMRKVISDVTFASKLRYKAAEVISKFETEAVCLEWEKYLIEVAKSGKN